MLSEFECQACKTRFVVASTQNDADLPTVFCVYCGHRSLRYLGCISSLANLKGTPSEPSEGQRIIVTQNEIRDVFGIGQEVLVNMGTEWVPRKILAITVRRKDYGLPISEPRFWFKDIGNAPLGDVIAKEDIKEG